MTRDLVSDLASRLSSSPIAEKTTALTTQLGGGTAVLSSVTWFGLSKDEWLILCGVGGFIVSVMSAFLNAWIRSQHLALARDFYANQTPGAPLPVYPERSYKMNKPRKPTLFESVIDYLSERFTREKFSSIGGVVLAVISALGYLTGPEVLAIHELASVFGIDLGEASTYAGLAGVLGVLIPTSRRPGAVKSFALGALGAGLMLSGSPDTLAQTVVNRVMCEIPTSREDGSTLSEGEVSEIRAYYSRCDGSEGVIASDSCELDDAFELPIDGCVTRYETTAVDSYGKESVRAEPVSVENKVAPPNPPTSVSVDVIIRVNVQ